MAKLKPYEEYREVDLPWVEKVPSHWEISYIKYLFNISRGRVIAKTELDDNGKYPVYSSQTENYGCLGYINTYDYEGDKITWTTDGENAGTVFLRRGKYNCTNICGVLTPISSENTMFIYHALRYIAAFYKRKDTNGYKIMSYEMAKIPIIIPPKKEQDQIAKFLDNRLSKINRFIKAKKKQVELLKEQKQAIINQAVMKGIDPNVPMKDSGVEWIGEIPKHWDITKLRYIGSFQNGISADGSFFGTGSPFISYDDVYSNFVLPVFIEGKAQSTIQQQQIYSIKENDILFTRTSETIDEIGLTSVCTSTIKQGTFSGFLIRFRPKCNMLNSVFSKYYFRSNAVRNFLTREMNIVTRASLSQGLLKNLPVLLPSLFEQKKIGKHLDAVVEAIDKVINTIQDEINLIKEYRTSLISEVVTGKVDVRDVVVEDTEEFLEDLEEV